MSGIWFGGTPGRIVAAAQRGMLEPVVSPRILTEYRRVEARMLDRLGPSPHPEVLDRLVLLGAVVPDQEGPPITADSDDDKFMWAAWAAHARVVSGDRHLLDASGWRGVRVITPRSCVADLDLDALED